MKRIVTLLLFGCRCALSQDPVTTLPDLATTRGEHYKQVAVTSKTPDTVSFTHDSGVATLPWKDIPEDLRVKLGYDAAQAEEAKKQRAAEARASTAVPGLQLSPTTAKYKVQLEKTLSQREMTPITDVSAALYFDKMSAQLVPKMSEHVQLIMTKWTDVAGQLSTSGLRDEGVERVFLKQFSQEDTVGNIQFVSSARSIKDQLTRNGFSGSERVIPALMALFSTYASLCEHDRTPSAEPAAFMRSLRTEYEFFAVALIVFGDQLKPFREQLKTLAEKKP